MLTKLKYRCNRSGDPHTIFDLNSPNFTKWTGRPRTYSRIRQNWGVSTTCYEVYIRFPTDVKLLWEAYEWLWDKQIPNISNKNKLKVPRSKYKEQHKKHLIYSKLRKKSHRKTKARIRATLHLLSKGITEFQSILNQTKAIDLSPKEANIFKTIKVIYQQQKYHFDNPKAKITDRIVSIYKPYIRPIVRGKENNPVEFGIKVHKVQVGGLA